MLSAAWIHVIWLLKQTNVMGFIITFVILALSSTKQKNVAWTEFERNDHACILPVMSLIC